MRKLKQDYDNKQFALDSVLHKTPLHILTNRMNVMQIISTGLIRPRDAYDKYYEDPLQWVPGRIPIWVGNIPANIERHFSEEHFFSVIIELNQSFINLENIPALSVTMDFVQSCALMIEEKAILLFLPTGVIPISSVNSLHFMTADDLSDFKARGFDNIDLDSLPVKITPELFSGPDMDMDQLRKVLNTITLPEQNQDRSVFRRIDAFAGAIAMVAVNMPDSTEWINALGVLLDANVKIIGGLSTDIPLWIAGMKDLFLKLEPQHGKDDFVSNLLDMTVRKLCSMNFRDGITPDAFVNDLINDLLLNSNEKELDGLERFRIRLKQILENETTKVSFSDDVPRKIVQRALTLFLMRPDPERVMKTAESSIAPGRQVLALSALISGAFSGYARLPKAIKRYPLITANLSSIFAAFYNIITAADILIPAKALPTIKIDKHDDNEGLNRLIHLRLGSNVFASIRLQPDDSMMQFFYHAIDVFNKKHFEYSFDDKCFRLRIERDGCSPHLIIISKGRQALAEGGRRKLQMITFKVNIKLPKARKNQIAIFEFVLRRNLDTGFCKYAFDDKIDELCIMSEQIVETMDREELIVHINGISNEYYEFQKYLTDGGLKIKSQQKDILKGNLISNNQ